MQSRSNNQGPAVLWRSRWTDRSQGCNFAHSQSSGNARNQLRMASVPQEGSQSLRNQQSLLHLQDRFASLPTALKSVTHRRILKNRRLASPERTDIDPPRTIQFQRSHRTNHSPRCLQPLSSGGCPPHRSVACGVPFPMPVSALLEGPTEGFSPESRGAFLP